jgi:hypothetical protein
MQVMKRTLAFFSTKQGHQSIAEAIKEKIEDQAGDRYKFTSFILNSHFH